MLGWVTTKTLVSAWEQTHILDNENDQLGVRAESTSPVVWLINA